MNIKSALKKDKQRIFISSCYRKYFYSINFNIIYSFLSEYILKLSIRKHENLF